MCGIVGFLASPRGMADADVRLRRMVRTLRHRGPDDSGCWIDQAGGIALGHRRLAILDLSAEGHQPMISANGRYVLSFNGEIYNFRALRRELESRAHTFRGHSDTEVLLAAFVQWGLEASLRKLNGMFALALWDRERRELHLARDRVGEKPLYYGWNGECFLFASELKALAAHPQFRGQIDTDSLALFLRHNYVPGPYSIYRGIQKLAPGCWATVRTGGARERPEVRAYWSARAVVEQGAADPFRGTAVEATAELDALLRDAVRLRMEADVPLGAFLSGGVDSSVVVALMQAQSARPVQTFSIGFNEPGYNEAHHARRVADYLGTEHTELYVTADEALAVIPRLPALYDEPFADSSQIPTFLVSQLARRRVTVSLSGDGGDELFAGYDRYHWGRNIWNKLRWLPSGVRASLAGALARMPAAPLACLLAAGVPVSSRRFSTRTVSDQLVRAADLIRVSDPREMYLRLVSHWSDPAALVPGAHEGPTPFTDQQALPGSLDLLAQMQYVDLITYLPDDILVKVDRASMAVGLEARLPLLDHRIVEFACRLPSSLRIRRGTGKWLLRQVLYRHAPARMFVRPKMGFGVPIGSWLRGPLRAWAEELLDEDRLDGQGILNTAPIRQRWLEHVSGVHNWQYPLWGVLAFQAWMEGAASVRASAIAPVA